LINLFFFFAEKFESFHDFEIILLFHSIEFILKRFDFVLLLTDLIIKLYDHIDVIFIFTSKHLEFLNFCEIISYCDRFLSGLLFLTIELTFFNSLFLR